VPCLDDSDELIVRRDERVDAEECDDVSQAHVRGLACTDFPGRWLGRRLGRWFLHRGVISYIHHTALRGVTTRNVIDDTYSLDEGVKDTFSRTLVHYKSKQP
jgi:hypothetical protein